jgi:hypothetical protein
VNQDLRRNQPDIRRYHENARLRFPRAGSSTWRFAQHCAEAEQVVWHIERMFDGGQSKYGGSRLKSREPGFRLAGTGARRINQNDMTPGREASRILA